MAATAEIVVTWDEQTLEQSTERTKRVIGRVEEGVGRFGQRSNAVSRQFVSDQQKARDAASLLSRTLGVEIPRTLEKVVASSRITQGALAAAFNVAVALAFADAVSRIVVDAIVRVQEQLNKTQRLIDQAVVEQVKRSNRRILEAAQENRALELRIAKANASDLERIAIDLAARKRDLQQEIRIAVADADLKGARDLQAQIKNLETAAAQETLDIRVKAELTFEAALRDSLRRRGKALAEIEEQARRHERERNQLLRETQDQNLELLLSTLEGEARVAAELEAKIALLGELKRQYEALPDVVANLTGQEELLHRRAAIEIREIRRQQFEEFRRNAEALGFELESIFDDITSGNIGRRILAGFKRMFFQILAQWLLTTRQMQAATANIGFGAGGFGGFGGLAGILGLGGLFGGLRIPGIGPGGTAPTFPGFLPIAGPAAFGAGLAPGTLSAGGGVGLGTVLPAGAVIGARPTGLLAALGPAILPLMLGVGLLGSRNRALRGVGGFLTGGGLGLALGGAGLGLIGGVLGAALPIVGALAGLFLGLFLGGSTRKARLQIEEQIKRDADVIRDAYNFGQLDFLSARSQLEQLREQGVDALRRAGVKDIGRARRGHVDQWIDRAIAEINATESERQRRLGIQVPPPLFHRGGSVLRSFQSGGAVMIAAEPGEFVFRREAVRRIGRARLERMNAGEEGAMNVTIVAWDGQSVDEWLRRGGTEKLAKGLRRLQLEGAL